MSQHNAQRAEDCRFAVLAALVQRAHGAHTVDALTSIYLRGTYSQDEVLAALSLMQTTEPPLLRKIPNPPPATGSSYQITLAGLNAYENRA